MLKAFSDSSSVSNVLTSISSVSFHSPKNENNFQEETIFLARVGRKIPENEKYVEKYMVQKKNKYVTSSVKNGYRNITSNK